MVYFHPDGEQQLKKGDVRVRVGLKESEDPMPICYCFGFTEAMAREEIRATGKCTIPRRIAAEIKAGNCACEIRNPQGSCCLGNATTSRRQTAAQSMSLPTKPRWRAGVGVQTLHYYERLGLLPKPERSAANYRLYAPEALRRVQFIKKAQANYLVAR